MSTEESPYMSQTERDYDLEEWKREGLEEWKMERKYRKYGKLHRNGKIMTVSPILFILCVLLSLAIQGIILLFELVF